MVQFHAKDSEKNFCLNKNYLTDENQLLGDYRKDFLITNRDDYDCKSKQYTYQATN